jgi:hypothetical protein
MRQRTYYRYLVLFLFLALSLRPNTSSAQYPDTTARLSFWEPAPTFTPKRFWPLMGTAAVGFTGIAIGLNSAWYSNYDQTNFHLFNDGGEWRGMDKAGHIFTAYFQAKWTKSAFEWTGVKPQKARWIGLLGCTLYQGTIEVFDGFSEKWGFSLWDIAANTTGGVLFVAQDIAWNEQRIHLKISTHRPQYSQTLIPSNNQPNTYTSADQRAADLYGTSIGELVLKEYNGITIWASVNPRSFINNPNTKFPQWLNIAVGYSAENMFGGFNNQFIDTQTQAFYDFNDQYPRYSQFLLAPDIDFSRIPTRSKGLKVFLSMLNILKAPAPALEITTKGKFKAHILYF